MKTDSDPWREAVHELCIVSWAPFYPDDPRRTLIELVGWEIRVALDPAVSSGAQALIDEGKRQARSEAA